MGGEVEDTVRLLNRCADRAAMTTELCTLAADALAAEKL